jgi:flavin reductase (DIM6/NTAB) family NADH-FMN oxidoreductase RutF
MADLAAIQQVFALTDPEVWLLTARSGTDKAGLIATFVHNASIVPEAPRLVVGLAKQHHTWSAVEASRAFILQLLSEEQIELVWRFGLCSGRDVDKWAGVTLDEGVAGGPLVPDALAWLECRVEAALDTGDRSLYLAAVIDGAVERPGTPLRMRRLIALAPPERLREMKAGLLRDAEIDTTAIKRWRTG